MEQGGVGVHDETTRPLHRKPLTYVSADAADDFGRTGPPSTNLATHNAVDNTGSAWVLGAVSCHTGITYLDMFSRDFAAQSRASEPD